MKDKLFLLLSALCCSTILLANGVKIGGIYYLLDDKNSTASVTYSSKDIPLTTTKSAYKGDINIPAKITYKKKEYRVISIGKYAFRSAQINSVVLPNSITSIEDLAFCECGEGLKEIKLSLALIHIGKSAFSSTGLSSITIPSNVIESGDNLGKAFQYTHMSSIDVSPQNKYLQSIDGVLYSKDMRYLIKYPCNKTDSIYMIPDGVEYISEQAFHECKNLKTIVIPNSVKLIGKQAFRGCSKLENLTIGENVSSLGEEAFAYCHSLKSVIIPRKVNFMWKRVFFGCSNIEEIVFLKGVTDIGEEAFSCCSRLSKISVPSSVSTMGKDAFGSSSLRNLKELNYEDGFKYLEWMKKKYFIKEENCHVIEKFDALSVSVMPLLAIVDNSLSFIDASNNNCIDAGETCSVRFKIINKGNGAARNCETRVKLNGNNSGISVKTIKLPTIASKNTFEITIPITADLNTQNGKVTLSVEVYEPNGFGVSPFDITVATKAYEQPLLQVVDYNVASVSGHVKKMEVFEISFNLQNIKYGTAKDVCVKLNLPPGVIIMDDTKEYNFATIKSGEAVQIKYNLIANNNYSATNIPITIDIKEKYGKFAENKQLEIALNQTTSSSINIAAKDEPQQERKEIQLAMMTAEVDRNIPKTTIKNPNTFALIIANENYQSVASVPFAINDGRIFRQYCEQTLGIPAKNIHEVVNATGNQMKAQLKWLQNVVEVFDNPSIIVYYAGHGIPDESSKTAYLLPVDGAGTDVSTGYKLDDLYATLGNMPASRITVFMDACFSGSKREGGMLASARGVALKAKSGVPQGNMVVFSAAQGNETAYPDREQQHGLFTYYLLKKLQETEGDVSLQELGKYIITNVKQQSVLLNSKLQTPCVTPSATLGSDWQNWKLK